MKDDWITLFMFVFWILKLRSLEKYLKRRFSIKNHSQSWHITMTTNGSVPQLQSLSPSALNMLNGGSPAGSVSNGASSPSMTHMDMRSKEVHMMKKGHHGNGYYGGYETYGFWWIIVCFIVLALIVWALLWAFQPDFVKKTDKHGNKHDEIDHGRACIWAVIIALILTFLVYVFYSCTCGKRMKTC